MWHVEGDKAVTKERQRAARWGVLYQPRQKEAASVLRTVSLMVVLPPQKGRRPGFTCACSLVLLHVLHKQH